jgi:hypothetical protein
MKSNGEQKMTKRYCSYSPYFLTAAVLFFICFNAYAQQSMQFDSEVKTLDSEKQIIAATKVESVFSSLLALVKDPERVKALKIAHKDWLKLRESHCAALMIQDVKKNNKKLIECYEAFDNQWIEIFNDQRISLLYDIPSEGTLPNDKINITFSQEQRGRQSPPRSVVVSAEAPVAAVTFDNDMTEIFDLVSGRLMNRIKTSDTKKRSVDYNLFLTPNGRILIGCFYMPETELMMWDVRTGELLRHKTIRQHNRLLTSQGRYVIYSDKESIGIYDLIKGEVTWNEKGKERTSLMAMSPDDKYLVAVRARHIENWELIKGADEKLSLVMRAAEPVSNYDYQPRAIAFANDNKSFYSTLPHGLIVQRRLPDLKEMRQLQFRKLGYAMLTQIKYTDILLMEVGSSYESRKAFYVDMVGETAQKIPEHTGANSKMVPLANGRVLLATPFELKTLNLPYKAGFGQFSDIIGEVIIIDKSIQAIKKDIVPVHINCQDFQIEAIGVYEGGSLPRGFAGTISGYVEVDINHTDWPVKLVLCSYEPVIWRLNISADARLSEIYLSGSSRSTVQGIQNIMVSHIGEAYAYKEPDVSSSRYTRMPSLAEVVKQKTGCNITKFQGVYKGSHFYIGYTPKDISEKKKFINILMRMAMLFIEIISVADLKIMNEDDSCLYQSNS